MVTVRTAAITQDRVSICLVGRGLSLSLSSFFPVRELDADWLNSEHGTYLSLQAEPNPCTHTLPYGLEHMPSSTVSS